MSVSPKQKSLPFNLSLLKELAATYGTPLYVYDEAGIRQNARLLKEAFAWSPGYKNHFAVKATPTPAILRLLAEEGMGFDCSSAAELSLVEAASLGGSGIFYTSNNTADGDYRRAADLNALINLDKAPYLRQVVEALGRTPLKLAIRYNPGGMAGNDIIGRAQDAKFGDTREHILDALEEMKRLGVQEIGLHIMIASNERQPAVFARVAELTKRLADEAAGRGVKIAFINLGGGIGVNYRPEEEPPDVLAIGRAVRQVFAGSGIRLYTECGRYVTGPHGYLLTTVTHGIVEAHRPFLTVDTSVNNLLRLTTVSDAYHHVSIPSRRNAKTRRVTVVGSMCFNHDKMFVERELPVAVQPGDLLVVHDAGAHARALATNYNGQPRCGEALVRPDGSHALIRRHETLDDIFATTEGL